MSTVFVAKTKTECVFTPFTRCTLFSIQFFLSFCFLWSVVIAINIILPFVAALQSNHHPRQQLLALTCLVCWLCQ